MKISKTLKYLIIQPQFIKKKSPKGKIDKPIIKDSRDFNIPSFWQLTKKEKADKNIEDLSNTLKSWYW